MIQSILIQDVATFAMSPPEPLNELRSLNYIFGSNGTGKTTISRVIASPQFHANSRCTWKNGVPLDVHVLNRDFIDNNFSQLRGVFTLGAEQKETEAKLVASKDQQQREQDRLTAVTIQLDGEDGVSGKYGLLQALDDDSLDKFWVPIQKLKQEGKLNGPLQGFLSNKQLCKTKILREYVSNTATPKPLDELKTRAATVFGRTPVKYTELRIPHTDDLLTHHDNQVLQKTVIGKGDVDIAAMIKSLGNSDWVRQGLPYYHANNRVCPFCQTATAASLEQSLADYFDKTFERDSGEIDNLLTRYQRDSETLQSSIDAILAAPGPFLDSSALSAERITLDQTLRVNYLRIDKKKKEPSVAITLEPLRSVISRIKWLLHAARRSTRTNNRLVDNLATEQAALAADVWRYVINHLDLDLKQYTEKRGDLKAAISALEERKKQLQENIDTKGRVIRELEKTMTSIQPTIDSINALLTTFGFSSFRLAKANDGKHYKLLRINGDDATLTLSEGEKTFVVFLYFYNLLRGSTAESGTTTDRIAVFDDPVSSLDSDVLFIVSTLIKRVCKDVCDRVGNIKQVFVLTHNVYFHRQVTFDPNRASDVCRNFESFWIIRKRGSLSKVERYDNNPIKSSYELLWHDVRLANSGLNVHPNILRRIFEYYFTIIGTYEKIHEVINRLDGPDNLVANDLVSFLHAGSHSVFDDIHMSPSGTTTEAYLRVFRQIFHESGHGAHYTMMMGPSAESR